MKRPYPYYTVEVRYHKKNGKRIVFYGIKGTLTFVLSEMRRIKKLENMDKYVITTMFPFESTKVIHESILLNDLPATLLY